ncbi:MAG: hypothetical protein VX951_04055 [Planctomycetota bacterium]|nr:hypothetical protein [Planctomycetota bacterium]
MRFVRSLIVVLSLGLALAVEVSAQTEAALPEHPYRVAVELPLNKPVADGVPVEVVTEDGKPVSGVSVLVVDNKQVERKIRMAIGSASRSRHGSDMEMSYLYLLCLHGKRFETDAKGRAMVTPARRGLLVVIDGRQTKFGTFAVREGAEPRPVRLVFSPPPGIDALVVDHRGKPVAGVPVALVRHWGHGHRTKVVSAQTARDGRVRLDTTRMGFFGSNTEMTYAVEPWIPVAVPPSVKIEPKAHINDPNHPIKLVLPQYGQVRVYVTDENDRPVHGVDQLYLRIPQLDATTTDYVTEDITEDYGTFRFVEVGAEVTVTCKFRGMKRPERVVAAGPRHFRELRVLTLKGVSVPFSASLIVHDAQGQPVRNEDLGVLFSGRRNFQGRIQRTDREGRLQVLVPQDFESETDGFLTVVRRGPGRRLVYKGALRVPLSRVMDKPALGPIKLQEEPLLVQGVVVDETGQPIQGVRISTQRHYTVEQYGSSSTSGRSVFFRHQVTTAEDGKFLLRELGQERGAVKLLGFGSSKQVYVVSGETAEVGAKNHKLVLGAASTIRGSMIGIPDKVSFPGSIRIRDKDGKNPKYVWASNEYKGKFTVRSCPPGTYKIEFNLPLGRVPFLVVDNVQVVGGKDCEDPRLQNIDIRKYGKLIAVEMVDEKGKPVGRGRITMTRKQKNGRSSYGTGVDGKGRLNLMVPKEGVEAYAYVSDGRYQVVEIAKLDSDRKIVMKPGFPVKLKVGNLPKLPGNVRIQVHARPQKPMPSMGYDTRYLSPGGELSFFVPMVGVYDLTLTLNLRNSNPGIRVNQLLRPPVLRYEFSIKAGKSANPKLVAVEIEEEDLEMIQEYVEEVKRK